MALHPPAKKVQRTCSTWWYSSIRGSFPLDLPRTCRRAGELGFDLPVEVWELRGGSELMSSMSSSREKYNILKGRVKPGHRRLMCRHYTEYDLSRLVHTLVA